MLYTLPVGETVLIRGLKNRSPLTSLLKRLVVGWHGDKIGIVSTNYLLIKGRQHFGNRLSDGDNYQRSIDCFRWDIFQGTVESVAPIDNAFKGLIQAGIAAIVVQNGVNTVEKVTFHLNSFAPDQIIADELAIARDAILEGNPQGNKLAKEILPKAYSLFVAVIERERALLKKP